VNISVLFLDYLTNIQIIFWIKKLFGKKSSDAVAMAGSVANDNTSSIIQVFLLPIPHWFSEMSTEISPRNRSGSVANRNTDRIQLLVRKGHKKILGVSEDSLW